MRRTTRSKYYGRNEVAGGLSTMVAELSRLVKSYEYHKFGGKRLIARLRKAQILIQDLHQEAVTIPVTPDEKLLAKVKRKKAKAKGG